MTHVHPAQKKDSKPATSDLDIITAMLRDTRKDGLQRALTSEERIALMKIAKRAKKEGVELSEYLISVMRLEKIKI